MCISHTSRFSLFLSIFKVIECLCLIFHVFQFSCHNQSLHCVFLIFKVFFLLFLTIFHVIQCISHFTGFSVFLAIIHFPLCEFQLFLLCQFSRHIPGPTVCNFHFSRFSVILTIFQITQCLCLIFHIFQFSHQNPGPTVCIFHTSRFSLFLSYPKSYSVCFLFSSFFSVFFPQSSSYSVYFSYLKFFTDLPCSMSCCVCFSFHTFSVFLAILHVLLCEFLLFPVCHFFHHIPSPTVCVSHFTSFSLSLP